MINKLINKGDYVAIEDGLLVIKPASGKPVPDKWLKDNSNNLVNEILKLTNSAAYRFTHHTTAVEPGYSSDRLTLWFVSYTSGCEVLAHFNVDLNRKRNGAKNKAGTKLPPGEFIPRKQSKYVQWWSGLNLPKPRYPSEYHRKLHHLKALLFSGETDLTKNHQVRFKDKNIELLNIDFDYIKLSSNIEFSRLTGGELAVKERLIGGEYAVKDGGEGNTATSINTGSPAISECVSESVRLKNNVIRTTCSVDVKKPPQEQSTDEWLADYNKRDTEILGCNQTDKTGVH